jgi:hypothetical protein
MQFVFSLKIIGYERIYKDMKGYWQQDLEGWGGVVHGKLAKDIFH